MTLCHGHCSSDIIGSGDSVCQVCWPCKVYLSPHITVPQSPDEELHQPFHHKRNLKLSIGICLLNSRHKLQAIFLAVLVGLLLEIFPLWYSASSSAKNTVMTSSLTWFLVTPPGCAPKNQQCSSRVPLLTNIPPSRLSGYLESWSISLLLTPRPAIPWGAPAPIPHSILCAWHAALSVCEQSLRLSADSSCFAFALTDLPSSQFVFKLGVTIPGTGMDIFRTGSSLQLK